MIGRFAAEGNEEVLAFVQRVPGSEIDEATLQDYLKDRLTPYKRPSLIVIADTLPSASTGKILKHKLLNIFAAEIE